MSGVYVDCNHFAEETALRWRGACNRLVDFNPAWKLDNSNYEANGFLKRYKEESTGTYFVEWPDGKFTQDEIKRLTPGEEKDAGRDRRLLLI
jgi:hypothetical protein